MSDPWFKFFPGSWRGDATLKVCSLAARGLWIEMLCLMHDAEPRGFLLVNGRPASDKQLAALTGRPSREITALISELEENGIFNRDGAGVIYSRRMRRDAEKAARDKANGALGGNPRLKGGVNPTDKAVQAHGIATQKIEVSSTSEANASSAERARPRQPRPKGTPLPEDWGPKERHYALGASLGLSRRQVDDRAAQMRSWAHGEAHRAVTLKSDWDATFDNWLRKENRHGNGNGTRAAQPAAIDARLTAMAQASGVFDEDERVPAHGSRRTHERTAGSSDVEDSGSFQLLGGR